MPTPHKTTENMRKHLTKAELAARQGAESGLRREKRVVLHVPKWLGDDARKIFEATRRRLKGLQILDPADADLLALYSDAVWRYREIMETGAPADMKEITAAQAWSRLALSYAEKLGISASARARLARRKTEAAPPDDMDLILDGVTEYVNLPANSLNGNASKQAGKDVR
jgi:phage terminase small subunit